MRRVATALVIGALSVNACNAEGKTSTAPTTLAVSVTTTSPSTTDLSTIDDAVADRPFKVFVPATYDGAVAVPLVILLHGFGITGEMQDDFFHVQRLAESKGFLMVSPDGTRNADGATFWNATDACCGFGATVDDSAYLAAVIQQVKSDYAVDAHRVVLVGFSNGGFMSYRMACDHADLIAGIVSISAATFHDPARCAPSSPVNVVEIHGTNDETIAFEGGTFEGTAHPSAEQTVADWAAYNGCDNSSQITTATRDLARTLMGSESSVTRYDGCPEGGAVELWTIVGGEHVPDLSSSFSEQVIDFLLAHPKP